MSLSFINVYFCVLDLVGKMPMKVQFIKINSQQDTNRLKSFF